MNTIPQPIQEIINGLERVTGKTVWEAMNDGQKALYNYQQVRCFVALHNLSQASDTGRKRGLSAPMAIKVIKAALGDPETALQRIAEAVESYEATRSKS